MIHVDSLGIRFDCDWVFQKVSFRVPQGSSAVLIGPSGSGKSVLLKVISGLLQPQAGQVEVKTKNLGMLFQKNALFDSLTVEENLTFPMQERLKISLKEARKRADAMLERVHLEGNNFLHPADLSGGMQKRLGIARALVVEPEVILYDEPTAGLDPITSRVIADLILELKSQRNSTVLTVTNDVQRARQLGDQIYLLANGELQAGGNGEEVLKSTHPAIRQFVFGLQKGPLTSQI